MRQGLASIGVELEAQRALENFPRHTVSGESGFQAGLYDAEAVITTGAPNSNSSVSPS